MLHDLILSHFLTMNSQLFLLPFGRLDHFLEISDLRRSELVHLSEFLFNAIILISRQLLSEIGRQ